MLRKQVADQGERRTDWWFWCELARRMGWGTYYPWHDEMEATDHLLGPLGLSTAELAANPAGVYSGSPAVFRGYERAGFKTRSGKVELYSTVLAGAGYDPVPSYQEPEESPVSMPEVAKDYPLILDAGRRVAVYTHSRHRNIPRLREVEPEPVAEIHPSTVGMYGIDDGDRIEVATLRGQIQLKARLTEGIRPDTISLLHGWEEANANLLTDDGHCDPIMACPPLRAGLCRVTKAV